MRHAGDTGPELVGEPTREEAEAFVRALVRWAGPGFHPDTDFNDYVRLTGERSFLPDEAGRLNEKLDRATAVLASGGDDVYDVASPVQREMLASALECASRLG